MSMQAGLEILERAAAARGKLLRAEGDRAGSILGALVLTFEVGRVVMTSADDGIQTAAVAERDALPGDLGGLEEEEPWWRLLGQPITAAWPGGVEEGVGARGLGSLMVLKLRFREEEENPRVVLLESTGNSIRASMEPI